jgi:beta-glucanase (GH16 family)
MRPRVVTGTVIAVLGVLVLTAGIAWPRSATPPTGPAAAAAAQGVAGALPTALPTDTPTGTATPTAAPSTRPSTVDSPQATVSPPPPVPGWTLVDYDNFDGTRLDRKRWGVYDSKATNGVSTWSPDMVTVAGGELRIAGRGRDPDGTGNVSGGLCWCRGAGSQAYGMWQVRARFEAGVGYGQALILWPSSDHWPQDGELDFAETPKADKKSAALTIHWGSDNQTDHRWIAGDFTQWHTYTVVWKPGGVQMLIDDKVYYDTAKSTAHPHVPSNPMHLAIQQEPGPFNPSDWIPAPNSRTPDTVTLHVDWVRLYR